MINSVIRDIICIIEVSSQDTVSVVDIVGPSGYVENIGNDVCYPAQRKHSQDRQFEWAV